MLTIGELARRSGCSAQGVRYYEQLGLLPEPARTAGNQRRYRTADAERLTFIRHARELGFSIEAVRELLALSDHPERPCDAADAIAEAHLTNVRSRIARLHALETELQRMLADRCEGHARGCRVIEALADHGRCRGEHEVPAGPAERTRVSSL